MVVPNDTSAVQPAEKPLVRIGTDTEISQDGTTRIVSDLEIHPQSGGEGDPTGPAGPPGSQGSVGPEGAMGPQGKLIITAPCMIIVIMMYYAGLLKKVIYLA